MLEVDDPTFETAAVRWLARFCTEHPHATLGEAAAALEALEGLPAPDAQATLTALTGRHEYVGSAATARPRPAFVVK